MVGTPWLSRVTVTGAVRAADLKPSIHSREARLRNVKGISAQPQDDQEQDDRRATEGCAADGERRAGRSELRPGNP